MPRPNGQISPPVSTYLRRGDVLVGLDRLGLKRGVPVEIHTASDVVPGYLVTLDDVTVGPLTLKRVHGSVSEHTIHDEVLLGMTFLRHFELSQEGKHLTVRARPQR